MLPTGPDYTVEWFQPHDALPVATWEVEVTPLASGKPSFVASARVYPSESCWAVDAPTDEKSFVRIRAVNGNQVSSWSKYTTVPEPEFAVSSLLAVGALGGLASLRRGSRGSGA